MDGLQELMTGRRHLVLGALVLALALLVAVCGGGGEQGGQAPAPKPTESTARGEQTVEIRMIPSIRFDKAELTIRAETDVTITAENRDNRIRHNFAVYTSRDEAERGSDPIALTETCTAPCTYSVTLILDAGEYFFRCEVHPTQMTGTFIVR